MDMSKAINGLTSEMVACPSVFGAYPFLKDSSWVQLSHNCSPVRLSIGERSWASGRFYLALTIRGEEGSVLQKCFRGGASSPRSLSLSLLSQCMSQELRVKAEPLADFLFDQLVPSSMRGLCRQSRGVGSHGWLAFSDIQEYALVRQEPCLVLGNVLRHPAAYMAHKWRSRSPLSGIEVRGSLEMAGYMAEAEPHLRAGGCLVLGTTGDAAGGKEIELDLPRKGWIMTGKRGGIERAARQKAFLERRPLLVVSRHEDAAPFLCSDIITRIYTSTKNIKNGSVGRFRAKLFDKLMENDQRLPGVVEV